MASFRGTMGQLLLTDIFPPDVYDPNQHVLDKKGLKAAMQRLAQKHPDKYREVSFKTLAIARDAAYRHGGFSFGVRHLKPTTIAKHNRLELQKKLIQLLDDESLSDDQREQEIIKLTGKLLGDDDREATFQEAFAHNNPLALQLVAAGRGNKVSLAGLLASHGLYQDSEGNTIPFPITSSYSQGLSPAEHMASTYGARQGVLSTKLATAEAGYFGKLLAQAAHRAVVTDLDNDGVPDTQRGLPVDLEEDEDLEGSLLALPVGGYKRNTVVTPRVLADLRKQGIRRALVRSPIAAYEGAGGGLTARDVGVVETGKLPVMGQPVGMPAAQALSERVSQGSLGQKHSGGVAGTGGVVFGFKHLERMIQMPKNFPGAAAHAQQDGKVTSIRPAPAGGWDVYVDNLKHYVPADRELSVKEGQQIEAGDVLSSGFPHPAEILRHKGLGEGRRYFVSAFKQASRGMGVQANRRNIELVARGLLNHVKLDAEVGDYSPDDVVTYDSLERMWQPREGYKTVSPDSAVGKYLEKPYFHYTIGTKVRPGMLRDFQEFGIKDVAVHDDPPPFSPHPVRAMQTMEHDPDWMTREYGSYLKGGLIDAVHRGGTSDLAGTSFVPSLAKGVDFGKQGPFSLLSKKKPGA